MIQCKKIILDPSADYIDVRFDEFENLDSIFDITKLYKKPIQQELDGTLECPKIIEQVEQPLEEECSECEGSGIVTISDFVGENHYEADCDCQRCDGTGRLDTEEKETIEQISKVEIVFNNSKFLLNYINSVCLFKLNGSRCLIGDNYIAFSCEDIELASENINPII